MAVSYAFAVGSVRAKENALLTQQDMEQLMLAASDRELAAMLRDKGYGDPAGNGGMDELLREETEQLWAYIWSVAPDSHLFDPFLIRGDLHNAKVLLRGALTGREVESLLDKPWTISPAVLQEAVKERRFTSLPGWLEKPMERAYDLLAHAGDAQLSDAVLDCAGMAAMLAAAQAGGEPVIRRYITRLVYYNNVKIVLRAIRTEKRSLFLEEALCPCEGMDKEEWIRTARSGEEEFLSLLERSDKDGPQIAEAYRHAPSTFEKWVDDRLMEEIKEAKTVTLGAAPLAGYLLAREAEIRALHMLASGIRTGLDKEAMRARGRMLYA